MKDSARCCDVCGIEIPKGAQFLLSLIPKEKFDFVEEVLESLEPELRPNMEMDSDGNLRMEICLECYLRLDIDGTETVN